MRLATLSFAALVVGTAISASAGSPCYAPSYSRSYAKPYVAPTYHAPVYYPPQVTVNLVGIPVPVAYEKPLALQGHSYFGYTKVHEAYGAVDLALVFDRAARLAENSQTLQSQATEGVLQLATTLRSDKVRQAEILAAAQGIAQVLRESRSTVETETTGVLRLQAPVSATAVLKASCVKCHETYGNAEWEKLDYETQLSIYERINHPDPSKRMPKAGDGKEEGEPLPLKSKILFKLPENE